MASPELEPLVDRLREMERAEKVDGKEIAKYRLHRARKGCLLPVKMKPAFIL